MYSGFFSLIPGSSPRSWMFIPSRQWMGKGKREDCTGVFRDQAWKCCLVMSNSLRPLWTSPPGSSDHGIFQARILGWVTISFARGSSRPRDQTHISCDSCISRWFLYHWATSEAYSRLGSSFHQFCPHLFGQDSVTWCHLHVRDAGKCSQAMCPGVKDWEQTLPYMMDLPNFSMKISRHPEMSTLWRVLVALIPFQMRCQVLFRYYLPGPHLWPVKVS